MSFWADVLLCQIYLDGLSFTKQYDVYLKTGLLGDVLYPAHWYVCDRESTVGESQFAIIEVL